MLDCTQQLGTEEEVSVTADPPSIDSVSDDEHATSSELIGYVTTTQVTKGVLMDMLEGLILVGVSEGLSVTPFLFVGT